MKKMVFSLILCLSVLFICSAAYAADFEITGGIDFGKDKISTFDSSKTITGTADEGMEIKIEAYDGEDDLKEDYSFVVGISGLFSQTVDFDLGENYIVVSSEDCDKTEDVIVNRKETAIKKALEEGVYLPGSVK